MPFTDIPFKLETDAANALELVSPPFLIKTLSNSMIPDPADVEKVDSIIRTSLLELSGKETIDGMLKGFEAIGLAFTQMPDFKIEQKNVSHKSEAKNYENEPALEFASLGDIKIKPSEKGGGITSQVNFATTAQTFDDLQNINKENVLSASSTRTPGFNPKAILATLEAGIKVAIAQTGIEDTPARTIFINQLARTLSGQFAVPAIEHVRKEQEKIFKKESDLASVDKLTRDAATSNFRFNAYLSSAVKDVDGAWIKDSLMNIGLGVLNDDDWAAVKRMVTNARLADGIRGLTLPEFTNINGFEKETDKEAGNALIQETLKLAKGKMLGALSIISEQIDMVYNHDLMTKEGKKTTELGILLDKAVGFMEHNEGMIGARQDTYLDTRKTQLPQVTGKRLHVVETRKDGIDSLYMLAFVKDQLDIKGLEAMIKLQESKIEDIDKQIAVIVKAREKVENDRLVIQHEIEGLKPIVEENTRVYNIELDKFKEEHARKNDNAKPNEHQIKQFNTKYNKKNHAKTKQDQLLNTTLPAKLKQLEESIANKEKEIKGKQKEQTPYTLLIQDIKERIQQKQAQ